MSVLHPTKQFAVKKNTYFIEGTVFWFAIYSVFYEGVSTAVSYLTLYDD
jgi:hypothetical protein